MVSNTFSRTSRRKQYSGKKGWVLYPAGDDRLFLHAYNRKRSLRVCPSQLTHLLVDKKPIGDTTYAGSGQKSGSVTSYLIRTDLNALEQIAKANDVSVQIRNIDNNTRFDRIVERYNIISRYKDMGLFYNNAFQKAIMHDIAKFCEHNISKRPFQGQQIGFSLTDIIRPVFPIPRMQIKAGDLVKNGKGNTSEICLINIGLDFSSGCIANVTPDGYYNPEGYCIYCYAYQNRASPLDTQFDFDAKTLVELIREKAKILEIPESQRLYIRLGQTTEVNIPKALRQLSGARNNLEVALEALSELASYRDIRVMMPTKVPEFDRHMYTLMKSSNTTAIVSFADEQNEPGIVAHGFDVERRLELARELASNGVNTHLYVAVNITADMSKMQHDANRAVEYAFNEGMGVQLLDLRLTGKEVARKLGIIGNKPGDTKWSDLKYSNQNHLFSGEKGRWHLQGNNYMCARNTDQTFLDAVNDNIGLLRMCSTHTIKDEQRCGLCFTDLIKDDKYE
jgi:DNA repair photolyase